MTGPLKRACEPPTLAGCRQADATARRSLISEGLRDLILTSSVLTPSEPVDYRRALAREILHSERQRALALTIVLTIALLATVALFIAAPEWVALMPSMRLWMAFANYLPFVAYELIILFAINRQLAGGRKMPEWTRYFSALIETSVPSVVLISHMYQMGMSEQDALGFFAPFLYFPFIILSTLRLDFWLPAFTGVVAALELLAIASGHLPFAAAPHEPQMALGYHLSRSAMLVVAGVVAGWVATRLRRKFEAATTTAAAHDRLTNLFGQHVSPQVVDRLLETGGAEDISETRRVAVMFVDIRGFTAAAQMRKPNEVVGRLNDAFAVLVEVIDRHDGIVNKFLGDGLLALFGAPLTDALATHHAVAAGREMLTAIEKSNANHPEWPIRIGIGLHTGEAVIGTVGSPRRKEYTVIGDVVNLAAHLEPLNKEFGTQFLLSGFARWEVGDEAADAVPLGNVPIRGFNDPVPLWTLA